MRSIGLLTARLVLGTYLAVHGVQKLLGAFEGEGLTKTAKGFERLGLWPGKLMASLAGASELGGGVLTATGIADPLGPLILAGTMTVASTTHHRHGALAQKGGYELPLTNFALAVALLSAGAGALRLGPRLSKRLLSVAVLAATPVAGASVMQVLRSGLLPSAK